MITRRRFLLGTAATAAVGLAPMRIAAHPQRSRRSATPTTNKQALQATPSPVAVALSRMAWGPRPGDVQAVTSMGLDQYIEQQLNPAAIDDSACDARIAATRQRIKYGAGTGYPASDTLQPLALLSQTTAQLWSRSQYNIPQDWQERMRPWNEVRIAMWLRAMYSKRQLQEVLVDFWHNHFNVSASSDAAISAAFPTYDRDVIRKNCFGNFRVFLEDVAKSTAMLYFLDNVSNKAGGGEGGNENYARELFELHTLGSDNYLKFFDDRTEIGTDQDGNARGYIDDDVYETARCFSGWTVANGYWERPTQNTGEFLYDPSWHDTAQKIVLSPNGRSNIPRNLPALEDGRRVLTLLANHRGTARHLCTKLCRRLIADDPPQTVIDAAVETWMATRDAPDQIKQVVRVILRSSEFQTTWGQKIKRPFEMIVSYLRATNAELQDDYIDPTNPDRGYNWASLGWQLRNMGHRLFEWPTPTGHPDVQSYWASTDGMLRRWNLPYWVTQWWSGNVQIDLQTQTPAGATCTQIVDFWIDRLCGFALTPTTRQALIDFMAQGGNPNQPPKPTSREPDWNDPAALIDRLNSMVQLLAMTPEFQMR